jgi:3-hydroxyisobutyrate dehydrogenase
VKIGVIGTGLMGASMALRLLSAGHRVWVYNRTPARLKSLELAGTIACPTPLALVETVEAALLMVTDGAAVRQSALYAPTFDKKLHRMQTRQFADPNFPTKHLLKDMGLFVAAAEAVGLTTLPAESVRCLVEQAVEAGFADDDYAALFNLVSPLPE